MGRRLFHAGVAQHLANHLHGFVGTSHGNPHRPFELSCALLLDTRMAAFDIGPRGFRAGRVVRARRVNVDVVRDQTVLLHEVFHGQIGFPAGLEGSRDCTFCFMAPTFRCEGLFRSTPLVPEALPAEATSTGLPELLKKGPSLRSG